MHRSGTSAVTRALGALGASLGDDLMPAGADNPRGFYEDAGIHALNLALLRTLGHDWDTVTPVLPEDLSRPGLEPFRRHAAALLRARIKAAAPRPFAFKDPRLCRLLPFWKQVFSREDWEPFYVIVNRHPAAVAASLAHRNGFAGAKSELLWLEHMFAALRQTTAAERVVVSFEALLAAPGLELRRLAAAARLSGELDAARQVLERGLRHHRENGASLPAATAALYRLLEAAASDQIGLESSLAKSQLRETGAWLANAYHALRTLDAGAPASAYAAVSAVGGSDDACAVLAARLPSPWRRAAWAWRRHRRALRARRQIVAHWREWARP